MQGCSHNCPGCQNPTTHDFNSGESVDVEDVKYALSKLQGEASLEIAKYAHSIGLDVWCYTGFTYEEIVSNEAMRKILDEVDVLVDGKFIAEEFSLDLKFKGSKNQRIIDVKKSLEENNESNSTIEKYPTSDVSLEAIDEKMMTIDDFLDDIEN